MPDAQNSSSPLPRTAIPLDPGPSLGAPALAALIAAVALAIVLFRDSTAPNAGGGAAAAGWTLSAGLAAALFMIVRAPRGAIPGSHLLAMLSLVLATTAVAAAAGATAPLDVNLFTIGRPPGFEGLAALGGAAIAAFIAIAIGSKIAPRSAAIALLVPSLTLEGLPLGTPPWLMLAIAVIALAASPPQNEATPATRRIRVALLGLLLVYLVSSALGADPGTSLPGGIRVTALVVAAFVVLTEGRVGVGIALGSLLVTTLFVSALAVWAKLLLASGTAGLHVDVFGSELSLFSRHPNLLAPWFGAAVVVAGTLAFHPFRADEGPPRSLRLLARLTLPVVAAILLLTASRLAILATTAAFVLPLVARIALQPRHAKRAVFALLVTIAALVIGTLTIPPLKSKVMKLRHASENFDHRGFRMSVGWSAALDRPWLGQGPLCYFRQGEFTPRTNFEGESSSDHPHCLAIAVFEGCGIAGLLAFLLLLVACVLSAKDVHRSAEPDTWDRALMRAALLALVAQLLTNTIDMGDALSTLIPSCLPIDVAMIGALTSRRRDGEAMAKWSWPALTTAAVLGPIALLLGLSDAHAERAREFGRQKMLPRAIDSFESAVALTPFDTDLRLDLAMTYFRAGKRLPARDMLDAALKIAPLRPDLHESLARLRIGVDDRQGALDAARRALELDPFGALPRRLGLLAAELEFEIGDRGRALLILDGVIRLDIGLFGKLRDPEDPKLLRVGAHSIPIAELIAVAERSIPTGAAAAVTARVQLRIIEIALATKDFALAHTHLDAYHAALPEAPSYYDFLGRVLLAEGRLEEALVAANEAISRFPTTVLFANRGDIELALGKQDAAIADYENAFPVSKDVYFEAYGYHDVLTRLAEVYHASGREADRARTLERIAFFTAEDLDRARALVDAASAHLLADPKDSTKDAANALTRALRLTLLAPANQDSRDLAKRLGERFAATRPVGSTPSTYADRLESDALALNSGVVAHEFRCALLQGLGLERRAKAATAELAAAAR